MSRARTHEVSSPISLFPFIGILLCTMGALLVVLVAVSRSARNTAQREVQSVRPSAAQPADDAVQKKLADVDQYVGQLKKVRGEAELKLRDEHARLSHIEDHIRRLQEKMRSLETAAVELLALEQEHYDDREQAQREIERLQKLVADSQKTVDSLREAASKAARSYAVVPYEGPNGTYRRPIYIECIKNELILQPEGIHVAASDLLGPLGPGNPLASVLRASREHLVRLNPKIGQSRDTEPYALLLVRPDGLFMYDRARQAIQAGDFDLGYELVESDWKLKYPQADRQLAAVQQQALVEGRARQQMLAAAAPRAYANAALAVGGGYSGDEFDDDDDGGDQSGGAAAQSGSGGIARGQSSTYVVRSGQRSGGAPSAAAGSDKAGGANGDAHGGSGGAPGNFGSGGDGQGDTDADGAASVATSGPRPNSGDNGGAPPNGMASTGKAPSGGGANGGSPKMAGTDKTLLPDGYEQSQSESVTAGGSGPGDAQASEYASRREKERIKQAEHRGKDWALRQKPAQSVPVRRTIHVAVTKDQLAISSDSTSAKAGGKVIPMRGDTVESLDEFVKQVRDQIDGWGIAGNGLYWRPVVVLSVAADAQRRADDLNRLLKNSGLDIRSPETATNSPQGKSYEAR
jgi:hypothetical protein